MYIESAIALIDLKEICKAALKLSESSKFVPASLVFGSDDFCASIGNIACLFSLFNHQLLVLIRGHQN